MYNTILYYSSSPQTKNNVNIFGEQTKTFSWGVLFELFNDVLD